MQRATTDVLYFETGPHNAVTMRVAAGEPFEVQTQLNRGPWLDAHPQGEALRSLLRGGNPSSGCVEVREAKVGQMLSVAIGPIALDPLGFTNYRGQQRSDAGLDGA